MATTASPISHSNGTVLTAPTFELVSKTIQMITEVSADKFLDSSRLGQSLKSIANAIRSASAREQDPFSLEDNLKKAIQHVAVLANEQIPEEQKDQVSKIKDRINDLLQNVNEDIRQSPIYRSPAPKPKKTAAERIEAHNKKAMDAIPLQKKTSSSYVYYPKTKEKEESIEKLGGRVLYYPKTEHKERYKAQIKLIPTGGTFVYSDQICLETAQLPTTEVVAASAMGNREYMEDFKMANSLGFLGKEGKLLEAEVACVCDGHNGSGVAKYVVENLMPILQLDLVSRLSIPASKNPTPDDIFEALKATVKTLHTNIGLLDMEGGTTAIISFKFQNKLYTANIGDSRGFINRNGKLIPMSIDQKPYGMRQKHIEEATQLNEYAHQIIVKKHLEVFKQEEITEALKEEVNDHKKMVVSHLYEEDGIDYFRLGITNVRHLDMVRSIGDNEFNQYLQRSPEIFCQDLLPGDQIILHSDGVTLDSQSIIDILEKEKGEKDPLSDTVVRLVQACIPDDDNVTLMVMTVKPPKSQKTE